MGSRGTGCCCCLLCTFFQFLFSIVVFVGAIVLVLWLVFRPNSVKVYVENASLTQFNLTTAATNNTLLNYNLTLDISVRNPNKRIGIYYDSIEARGVYDGYRFGFVNLPTFYQDHKNTTTLHPVFQGQQQVAAGTVATTFVREKEEGTFYIEVKLYANTRLKFWFVKSKKYAPKVDCTVKLPVPSTAGGGGSAAFSRTKCDVDFF